MKRIDIMNGKELFDSIINNDYCIADHCDNFDECSFCMKHYYAEEEVKIRLDNIHTKQDLIEANIKFRNHCDSVDCNECEYYTMTGDRVPCFIEYLSEELDED